jgi:hypothetical protein
MTGVTCWRLTKPLDGIMLGEILEVASFVRPRNHLKQTPWCGSKTRLVLWCARLSRGGLAAARKMHWFGSL